MFLYKKNTARGFHQKKNLIVGIVNGLDPDIIIFDAFADLFMLMLLEVNSRKIVFQTMLSTFEDNKSAPLNKLVDYRSTRLSRTFFKITWLQFYATRVIKGTLRKAHYLFQTNDCFMDSELKKLGIKKSKVIDTKRCFNRTIKGYPEIISCPPEFDIPYRPRPRNEVCVGALININTANYNYDFDVIKFVSNVSELKRKSGEVKFIYCSFGTIANIHNKKIYELIAKVLDAFDNNHNLFLMIAVGQEYKNFKFYSRENIKIVRFAPQIDILQVCDMIICHAGLNTIMEAIYMKVPMFVFPLNGIWDQNGNASRIHYHKLGIVGNIKSATSQSILKNSLLLIEDDEIRANIERMRERFLDYKLKEAELLASMLS